jgi:hypothetical protein
MNERSQVTSVVWNLNDDDDVYLINYNMAVGYKIYLHTNTNQPERHKNKMKSIRNMRKYVINHYHLSRGFFVSNALTGEITS